MTGPEGDAVRGSGGMMAAKAAHAARCAGVVTASGSARSLSKTACIAETVGASFSQQLEKPEPGLN